MKQTNISLTIIETDNNKYVFRYGISDSATGQQGEELVSLDTYEELVQDSERVIKHVLGSLNKTSSKA